jgi:hypothetical protein
LQEEDDAEENPGSSADFRETAGLHVVDEAPHLIASRDEGALLDPLDGVADIIF